MTRKVPARHNEGMKRIDVDGISLIQQEKDAIKEACRLADEQKRTIAVYSAEHAPSKQKGFLLGPYPMLKAVRDVKQHPDWTVQMVGKKQTWCNYLKNQQLDRAR